MRKDLHGPALTSQGCSCFQTKKSKQKWASQGRLCTQENSHYGSDNQSVSSKARPSFPRLLLFITYLDNTEDLPVRIRAPLFGCTSFFSSIVKINLFCFTDLEYHCHPVHHTTELSVCFLLHDFSSGLDPIAAGTAIQFLTEKHNLHITKGRLNSAYDKSIAKFSTIHPKALLCLSVCHK